MLNDWQAHRFYLFSQKHSRRCTRKLEIWMMPVVCEIWTLPEVCEIWMLPEVSQIWMLFEAYGLWRLLSAVWVLTSISTGILM